MSAKNLTALAAERIQKIEVVNDIAAKRAGKYTGKLYRSDVYHVVVEDKYGTALEQPKSKSELVMFAALVSILASGTPNADGVWSGHFSERSLSLAIGDQLMWNESDLKGLVGSVIQLLIQEGYSDGKLQMVSYVDVSGDDRISMAEMGYVVPHKVIYPIEKAFLEKRNNVATPHSVREVPLRWNADGSTDDVDFKVDKRNALLKHFTGVVPSGVLKVANILAETEFVVNPRAIAIAQYLADTGHKRMPRRDKFVSDEAFAEALESFKGKMRSESAMAKLRNNQSAYFGVGLDNQGRVYLKGGSTTPQGASLEKFGFNLRNKAKCTQRTLWWLKAMLGRSLGCIDAGLGDGSETTWEEKVEWFETHIEKSYMWKRWVVMTKDEDVRNPVRLFTRISKDLRGWDRLEHYDILQGVYQYARIAYALKDGVKLEDIDVGGEVWHLDGKANGLQHMAAIIGDKESADKANITERNRPLDIYGYVLSEALKITKGQVNDILKKLGRKGAKQPIMLGTYGARVKTIGRSLKSIAAGMGIAMTRGEAEEFANVYLYVMGVSVPALGVVTSRLHAAVEKACMLGCESIVWQLPDGFEAINNERVVEHLVLRGRTIFGRKSGKDEFNPTAQATSFSPNWVHSYDAYHAREIIRRCGDKGMDVAPIHDSFGTTLDRLDDLYGIIRDSFADMYKGGDKEFSKILTQLQSNPFMGEREISYKDIKKANGLFN